MEEFDLPPSSFADPEPGAPESIRHSCDYGFRKAAGSLDSYYNYFDYFWRVKGLEFRGRTYIDTLHRITIYLPFETLRQPDFADVRVWLQRRFFEISSYEIATGEGYVVRWQLRGWRAPDGAA